MHASSRGVIFRIVSANDFITFLLNGQRYPGNGKDDFIGNCCDRLIDCSGYIAEGPACPGIRDNAQADLVGDDKYFRLLRAQASDGPFDLRNYLARRTPCEATARGSSKVFQCRGRIFWCLRIRMRISASSPSQVAIKATLQNRRARLRARLLLPLRAPPTIKTIFPIIHSR
jgi:hypothetical protein